MAHDVAASAAALDQLRAVDGRATVESGGPSLGMLLLAVPLIVSAAGILTLAGLTVVSIGVGSPGVLAGLGLCVGLYLAIRLGRSDRTRPAVGGPLAAADWTAAQARFRAVSTGYAGYECDPLAVLALPALSDVTVPSTARFVDAFAEAQALDTDEFPGPTHAGAFTAAADRAVRAWAAARDAAGRIGLAGLAPADRATIERVTKLLVVARDSDNEAERLAAAAMARAELTRLDRAGVVRLPPPARAALDTASRGSLAP